VDLEDDELNGDKEITEEAPGLQDKEDRLMGKQPMDTNLNAQEAMTPLPLVNPLVFVPRAKCGKQPIISDATLRRSERLHKNSKGFKNQICKTKNCLGCSSDPPTLSSSVVRDLGATFCNLDPSSLTDEKLKSKDPKKMPISKPKSKKAKKDNDAKGVDKDSEDGGPSTSK